MKSSLTIAFLLLFCSSAKSQDQWQEFLSHERNLISANGHLLINDTLHLAYNDGIRKIAGNMKPENLLPHYANMYNRIKTTRTGVNSAELLLLEAFDYDISGLGLISFRNVNNEFWGKEQFGYEEFETDFQTVPDGIISPSTTILDQVIDHNNDLVKLNDDELEATSPSPVEGFHEGLDNNFFAIIDDSLFSYTDTSMSAVFYLGEYDNLLNDPYTNSLIIEKGNSLTWFSYDDFTLEYTVTIQPNSIGIQIIENGFYQLVDTDDEYIVYEYGSPETPTFSTTLKMLKEEDENFIVEFFEVTNNEVYFIGETRVNGIRFHYAQRRIFDQTFEPERMDLAIDTFSVIKSGEGGYDKYDYNYTVRNNGDKNINSFAVTSPVITGLFEPVGHSFIRSHVDVEIAPNEVYTHSGTVYASLPSQLRLIVSGVNYALDSNDSNNEYVADVITLSANEISKSDVRISPNPASKYLKIEGLVDKKALIKIFDSNGKVQTYKRIADNTIDISALIDGIYNVVITDKNGSQTVRFTKF